MIARITRNALFACFCLAFSTAASLANNEPLPPEAAGPEPPPTSVTFLAEDTTDTAEAIARDLLECVETAMFVRPRVECVILEGCGVSLRYMEPDPVPMGECLAIARRRLEALP